MVACCVGLAADQQPRRGSPEAAILDFFTAIYANDVAAYERVTLPHPERSRLTRSGQRNDERLQRLREDPGSLQMSLERSFQLRGQEIVPGPGGEVPVGTTVRYTTAHQGSPMIVSLVREIDGWKVDLRWWIAMTKLTGDEPPRTSPDYAIKNLLLAMLALNKNAAQRFIVSGGSMETLWTAAPRYREPSGVLEASVIEMPLVEYGAGEFVRLPSGRVVEGGAAADRKLLVGLYGPIEMGFVARRQSGDWRVEVEPYFLLLNR
jgi:hypothetical protein